MAALPWSWRRRGSSCAEKPPYPSLLGCPPFPSWLHMPPSPQVHVEPLPSPAAFAAGPWHPSSQWALNRPPPMPAALSPECVALVPSESSCSGGHFPLMTQDTLTSLRTTRETGRRAHVTPRFVAARAAGASSSNSGPVCCSVLSFWGAQLPRGTPTGCRKKA